MRSRDNELQPETEASSSDPWARAAHEFYGARSQSKMVQRRYMTFATAYKRVSKLLGLDNRSALVDVGCGCGELAAAVSDEIRLFCGLDICMESLLSARRTNPQALFVQADMTALPLGQRFDCATAISSLEFCFNKSKALREIHACLSDGGRFYIEVRNADFMLWRLLAPVSAWLEKHGLIETYPARGFRDLGFREWKDLLETSGFAIITAGNPLRPANYGNFLTRFKNLLIKAVAAATPLRCRYMIGFLCSKNSQ